MSWFINTPCGKLVFCCHKRSLRQFFCIMFDAILQILTYFKILKYASKTETQVDAGKIYGIRV